MQGCKGTSKVANCKKCGKQFIVYPYQAKIGEGKYCSKECANLGRIKLDRNKKCLNCGKHIKYDSIYCVKHSQIGERGPNWQGGKTKEAKLLRNRLLASGYAKKIFERDEWTCVLCGYHGGKLHAHHLLTFKDYPELRDNIDNGITLCENCHKYIHYGVSNGRIINCIKR